jgi:4-hydroxybenzoate polyprenyltransferase
MADMNLVLELLATLCAAIFAGAAIYINLVEHPARMSLGTAAALAEWRPAYRRATFMQAPLAIVGLLASVGAWATGGRSSWLVGGLLLGAVVPFTLLVTFPTNKRLLDPDVGRDLDQARRLLDRWNRLHAVRSLLGLAALMVFLALLR